MTNELQKVQGAQLAAATISADFYGQFIRYIDRGPKTTGTYLRNLRQFAAYLSFTGNDRPTRETVLQYRDYLATEHDAIEYDAATGWKYRTGKDGNPERVTLQASTVQQYIRTVRAFFSWTASAGLYPNVAANVHAPKVTGRGDKKDALTPADVRAINSSITEKAQEKAQEAASKEKDTAGRLQRATEQGARLHAIYSLAVNCGLRTVELSRLNVGDLQRRGDECYLMVWGKGHSEADTKKVIAVEVYDDCRAYLETRADKYNAKSPLFVSTGNRSGGKRIAPTTISSMIKRAMIDAGYNSPRLTAHSCRHTTACNVLQISGNNIYLTQNYCRHASPATTEIYLHRTEDAEKQQRELAERLYKRYAGTDQDGGTDLGAILATMGPDKLQQLATIAAALR